VVDELAVIVSPSVAAIQAAHASSTFYAILQAYSSPSSSSTG
jgi:hypothetical protein